MAARITPALRETSAAMHTGVRALTSAFFRSAKLVDEASMDLEVERFAALIDGLALGGTLHPDKLSGRTARAVVRAHLRSLGALPG